MPLITCDVKGMELPFFVIEINCPDAENIGSIAFRLVELLRAVIVKISWLLFQLILPKEELFLASSHVSICLADITGTCLACADAIIASAPALVAESLCIFVVNTP